MSMAAFGISFLLFFAPAGCPAKYDPPKWVLGCVEYWKAPPRVYLRPNLARPTRMFVLRHEIGHIACSRRTPQDLSEKCADRWAAKRMPEWWRDQRKGRR